MVNPTEEERIHANERLDICKACNYYDEILDKKKWSAICRECSCPLSAKIFTPKNNPCRIGRWKEVDQKYNVYREDKTKKTLL